MFCYQCQETVKNSGCTVRGVCGKNEETACLQDLLIYVLKGIAIYAEKAKKQGVIDEKVGLFITRALFATITNTNFDDRRFITLIQEALRVREGIKKKSSMDSNENLHDATTWFSNDESEFRKKAKEIGVLLTENEDIRSLRELLTYGVKGIAAYAEHAAILGKKKQEIYDFITEALAATTKELSVDELVALVLKTGEIAVTTMALLDEANTSAYGNPEITKVNIEIGRASCRERV